ncbi:DUF4871 domain-containing protein [Paenibacillus thermotolerans]|uniref:DUF4871 domain-containing protein n=1 Tax=Paenibacillus thermotolerans TaxID=3027807 RepID=UPI002367F996|nr:MULTISPECIES: DUF4871 domain-containing protein [unclassified Paenibacillus]
MSKNWQLSPVFNIPVTFGDGTEGEYVFIGEEGKLAMQVGSGKEGEAQAQPIVKGKGNKYMWYFWGSDEELNGKLKVEGINEKGERHLLIGKGLGAPYVGYAPFNGADSTLPATMMFPTAGLWKLEAYISDNLYGEITLHVDE